MSPEDERIHVMNIRGAKIGDYVYTHNGGKEKFDRQAARIAELEVALIDCRAEYLMFLDENPNAFAWDFDELSRETQDRYREDARKSLELEEPVIAIQLREAEAKIAELEADLEQEEHNNEAFMDKIGEQACYIVDLENQIKALKKIAEDERAAVLTADICDGCDSYGDMSISGRAALRGEPTRVDDFEGREERIAMARRQLAEEHPEAFG